VLGYIKLIALVAAILFGLGYYTKWKHHIIEGARIEWNAAQKAQNEKDRKVYAETITALIADADAVQAELDKKNDKVEYRTRTIVKYIKEKAKVEDRTSSPILKDTVRMLKEKGK
jgi:uncharacterized DUF497 family protein